MTFPLGPECVGGRHPLGNVIGEMTVPLDNS